MRNPILIFLLIIVGFSGYGQVKKTVTGDTVFWHRYFNKDLAKLKLPSLDTSTKQFYFRFSAYQTIVDIWSDDKKTFNGVVSSHINSYIEYSVRKKTKKDGNFFFKRDYLDTSLARKAYELTKLVAALPSYKAIKGWSQGVDGITYALETASPTSYDFRNYWTPSVQSASLKEAGIIQGFVDSLYSLLSLKNKFESFFRPLKGGSYSDGSVMIITKMSPKQTAAYIEDKPNRDYLNSVSDQLNTYLTDTLNKALTTNAALNCEDTLYLLFSKENKLLKVDRNEKSEYKGERKQFAECRRKITAAFKSIKIDFVNSRVSYWRNLTISAGRVTVTAN